MTSQSVLQLTDRGSGVRNKFNIMTMIPHKKPIFFYSEQCYEASLRPNAVYILKSLNYIALNLYFTNDLYLINKT